MRCSRGRRSFTLKQYSKAGLLLKRWIWIIALSPLALAGLWIARSDRATPLAESSPAIAPTTHSEEAVASANPPRPFLPDEEPAETAPRPIIEASDPAYCEQVIQDATGQLIQYDDERLRAILLEEDDIEVYRGLGIQQLEHLAAQGDSAAMVVLALALMVSEMGLEDTDTVPLVQGEIDEGSLTGLDAPSKLAPAFRHMADWMYEAAVHGRLEAFKELGEPLEMAGLTAVDLGWLDAAAYESLSDLEKRRLKPGRVYETAYYLLDPDLRSSISTPYAEWIVDQREDYGPLLEEVVQPLANELIKDMQNRGFSMPEIPPPMTVAEYLERTGSTCRPD